MRCELGFIRDARHGGIECPIRKRIHGDLRHVTQPDLAITVFWEVNRNFQVIKLSQSQRHSPSLDQFSSLDARIGILFSASICSSPIGFGLVL